MRDLDVTPNTIVQWHLKKTTVRHIHGTFSPLHIDGDLLSQTRDFEVFDRSYRDPARRHMIGVPAASIQAHIGVRANAFNIYDSRVTFGHSSLLAPLVSIGFHNAIQLAIDKKSKLDLSDISPLIDIPMSGKAELGVEMAGRMGDPLLDRRLEREGFRVRRLPHRQHRQLEGALPPVEARLRRCPRTQRAQRLPRVQRAARLRYARRARGGRERRQPRASTCATSWPCGCSTATRASPTSRVRARSRRAYTTCSEVRRTAAPAATCA